MPDHILRHRELMVDLSIVDLELEAHEVGQDGGGARVCFDWWRRGLAWCWTDYWKTMGIELVVKRGKTSNWEAIREDVWTWVKMSVQMSAAMNCWRSIPFHTERLSSTRVGNIVNGDLQMLFAGRRRSIVS